MRITIKKDCGGYMVKPYEDMVEVFVDGKIIKDCHTVDTVEGYAGFYEFDNCGNRKHAVINGEVKIVITKQK